MHDLLRHIVHMKLHGRYVAIYFAVSALAAGLLLIDTWPHPPASKVDWLIMFVMVLPVTVIGEWLSKGVLRNSFGAAVPHGIYRTRPVRWAKVFYFVGMCILFATTAVALFEFLTRS